MKEPKRIPALLFATVMELINDMPLDFRVYVANIKEEDVWILELSLGKYLLKRLKKFDDERFHQLSDDCRSMVDKGFPDEINEIQLILWYVWKILKDAHRLRAVK